VLITYEDFSLALYAVCGWWCIHWQRAADDDDDDVVCASLSEGYVIRLTCTTRTRQVFLPGIRAIVGYSSRHLILLTKALISLAFTHTHTYNTLLLLLAPSATDLWTQTKTATCRQQQQTCGR